ncbi:MAG: heparinase II/III family protein [Kiritimatiellia bacterium]
MDLLHEQRRLSSPEDWNNPLWPRLWLYHLHYFDGLCAEVTDANCDLLIERWVRENPPGNGCGWEPYPLSRRTVNWVKYILRGHSLSELAVHTLAIQARYLFSRLEYHLLGNHLLANATALVFAGLFFSGKEADRWYRRGMRILQRQLTEQILPDGGHIERSPMYHAIILEDLLDVIQLHRIYGLEYPVEWNETVRKMLVWLKVMTHPDGGFALFNDCALNVAAKTAKLEEYAFRLGITHEDDGGGSKWLEDSGYLKVEDGNLVLFFDAGPVGPSYQPGHAHADTFSLEVSIGVQRLIVDSGTSCYGVSPERLRQRGTAAHNTLSVDGLDSTEVWSSHRAGRKACVTSLKFSQPPGGQGLALLASHDGFTRFRGVGLHSRRLDVRNGRMVIEDRLSGTGQHQVGLTFHFHPDITVTAGGEGVFDLKNREGMFLGSLIMDNALRAECEPSTWHPEFGVTKSALKISGTCTGKLPMHFVTVLELAPAVPDRK